MAAHVDDYAVICSGWTQIEKKLRTIIATEEGGGKWGWTASASGDHRRTAGCRTCPGPAGRCA
eukprot:2852028-Rhodomonas_salina.1